jgi:integrase
MASVRQSRGRLFLDYRTGGERRRAYVKLADTPENQAHLRRVAKQVDAELAKGGDVDALLLRLGLIDPPIDEVLAGDPILPLHSEAARLVSTRSASARSPTPTFSSFSELWFTEFKVGWRKTYVTTVRGILDKYLIPKLGPTPVGEVSRTHILELRTELSKLKGRREGTKLSPARINTVMLIVRQILTEAADRYEFTMPMARLRPLKIPKSDVQPFTLEQTQLLIEKIRADYRDYLKVRFFTGLRSGEIHGLKWKYIDFERRLILVREAFVGGEDEYTKTDSSQRDISMSQVVYDALKRQHEATSKLGDYVFCNRNGEPIDTNNFTKRVWYS